MNVSQPHHNAWVGLAATGSQNSEAIRQLREVLPPESRIVSTADHPSQANVIADVIRGGEPCVLGCATTDSQQTLVKLVTTLRTLGSIRHVSVIESKSQHNSSTLLPTLTADAARAVIDRLGQSLPVAVAPLTLAVDARTSHLLHTAGGSFPW